jgi:Flp pilus assembly protein TadG
MRPRQPFARRSGASVVESAIVLPIFFLFVLGMIVLALGVFRYQEMAHIARETARYASVHGAQYAANNSGAATVDLSALQTYAASKVATLDTTQWTVTVTMTVFPPGATSTTATPPATSVVTWDDTTNNLNHSPYSSWTNTTSGVVTTADNLVTVTITYPWIPEAFLVGPINLTSTTIMAMAY